jgi:hypothetical protein
VTSLYHPDNLSQSVDADHAFVSIMASQLDCPITYAGIFILEFCKCQIRSERIRGRNDSVIRNRMPQMMAKNRANSLLIHAWHLTEI